METVAIDDRGLTLGVGLFETILVDEGRPVFWAAHLDRLTRGCARLGLPAPAQSACEAASAEALAAAGLSQGRAALRLTWTGGPGERGLDAPRIVAPRLIATAARAPDPPRSLSLAIVSVRRNPTSPTSRLKTLSYLDSVVARQEAASRGADEALMLNTLGDLACAAAANLFWTDGDTLWTPSLATGALDGVTRREVLQAAPAFGFSVAEVEAAPEVLDRCDGGFLTNSLIGAAPAASVDGRPLAAPGRRLTPLLLAFTPQGLIARGAGAPLS